MKQILLLLLLLIPILGFSQRGTINLDEKRGWFCGFTYVSTPGTMTIATGGTFEKLHEGAIAYTAGHLNNFTESNGRLTYTGVIMIHATVNVSMSIKSDETAQLTQFRITKNGTTIAGSNMASDFVATDHDACVSLGWLLELVTGDYIEVFGTSDTNADTFLINNLTLIIAEH